MFSKASSFVCTRSSVQDFVQGAEQLKKHHPPGAQRRSATQRSSTQLNTMPSAM